jgi:hypothetical protein
MDGRRSQMRNLKGSKLVIPLAHPNAAGIEDEKPPAHFSFAIGESPVSGIGEPAPAIAK